MFDHLSDRFEQTLKRLRGQARVTERNIEDAVREVRLALLEADVHVDVVRRFTEDVRSKVLGQKVLEALTPEQHFIKAVRDELAALMGGSAAGLDLSGSPAVIMLVGLHGAGKTTTAAKLARYLQEEKGRRPYLVPADVRRPAAIEQLATLAAQLELPAYPTREGADPVAVCRDAVEAARRQACDVVLLDTAGRLHIDDELMAELARIRDAVSPQNTVLVVDAMTGQDAVSVAGGFHQRLGLTGIILTKLDGDARGGAALSARAVTGAPVLFAGVGEKLDALEVFHPDRMANRILGMGDVLTLIEKAQKAYDAEQARRLQRKMRRNELTLEDFRQTLDAVQKMGRFGDLVGMLPGLKRMMKGEDFEEAERQLRRYRAIIDSMTRQERDNPGILNGSRRRRIAAGSGVTVAEVNRLLKEFQQTKKVMKRMVRQAGRLPLGALR